MQVVTRRYCAYHAHHRRLPPSPRPAERYASKEDYLYRVQQAAEVLVQQRYLLAEDLSTILEQASQRYDLLQSRMNV